MSPNDERDLELISAFLEDALTAEEQQALGSRLAVEPALRTLLDELRATQAVLRAAPVLKLPRDFRLTAGMVAAPSKPTSGRVLQFPRVGYGVGALAAALLVLVFGITLLTQTNRAPQQGSAVALLSTSAPTVAEARDQTPPEKAVPTTGKSSAEQTEPAVRMSITAVSTQAKTAAKEAPTDTNLDAATGPTDDKAVTTLAPVMQFAAPTPTMIISVTGEGGGGADGNAQTGPSVIPPNSSGESGQGGQIGPDGPPAPPAQMITPNEVLPGSVATPSPSSKLMPSPLPQATLAANSAPALAPPVQPIAPTPAAANQVVSPSPTAAGTLADAIRRSDNERQTSLLVILLVVLLRLLGLAPG